MTRLEDLTIETLRQAISIKEGIERLHAQLAGIMDSGAGASSAPAKGRGVYKRSKAARAAMAAAQRARWAKIKGAAGTIVPKKRRKMSAAGRAKIAAAARARWARVKAAGKKRL